MDHRTISVLDQGCDVTYKVLLIGDSGVGKTAILRNVMGRDFLPKNFTTVGMDFVTRVFHVDGAKVQLQIWDTAGQERFRSMTRFQYRGTKGALLVYDITDRESFKTLNYWLDIIDTEIDQNNKEPIPVFLIGNKNDLLERRQVPGRKGQQMSVANLMHGFLETSAKTGKNVVDAFIKLTQAMTEINDPKLMDSYLDPFERSEKYERRQSEAEMIKNQKNLKKQTSRIRLKNWRRSISKDKVKCCDTG